MQAADRDDKQPAESLGLELKAYNWTWDLSGARGLNTHVVAISTMWQSHLFLFDRHGKLTGHADPTSELQSVELFDFDGDRVAEIITVQTTGRGTGVRRDEFVIYSANGPIRELWRAPHFWYSSALDGVGPDEQGEGSIRPAFGELVYSTRETRSGRSFQKSTTYRFQNGRFSERNQRGRVERESPFQRDRNCDSMR